MTDYWGLTRDFEAGDAVQQIDYTRGQLSPYLGRVTAVHKGIGFLDVQWPIGHMRMSAEDLVRVNPQLSLYLPPSLDQSFTTYDVVKARKASAAPPSRWPNLHGGVYWSLAEQWQKQASDIAAYDHLYRKWGNSIGDEPLRATTRTFYGGAQKLYERAVTARIDAAVHELGVRHATVAARHNLPVEKVAAYWFAQNRTHRATNAEIQSGRPTCPRCGTAMRATTYRMNEGVKHKIFACPKDLYLLDPQSILGPTGEPHNWFGAPSTPEVAVVETVQAPQPL